jgi:hypothetical protein
MKIYLVFVFFISLSLQSAFGQSLKANMKSANSLFKQISVTMNDASRNASNAAEINKMVNLFEKMKTQSPDSGSFSEYQTLTQELIVVLKDLESAFLTNDNAKVQSLMQKVNSLKKEGHDKYK